MSTRGEFDARGISR